MRAYAEQAVAGPGFVDAVVNSRVNALTCAVSCSHARSSPRAQSRRQRAVAAAVKDGPRALTDQQKLLFLTDPLALSQLHFEVWTSPAAHPTWLAACLPGNRGDHAPFSRAS